MGLFERFPYTNFQATNLDWVIKQVKKVTEEIQALYDAGIMNLIPRIDALELQYNSLATSISNLQANLTLLRNDLADMQAELTNFETNINQEMASFESEVREYLENLDIDSAMIPIVTDYLNTHGVNLDYVMPEMYGATGDGITDDKQAFLDCIADAVRDNKPVVLRNTTYYIANSSLNLDKVNVAGNGATIKGDVHPNPDDTYVLAIGRKDNISVRDLNTINFNVVLYTPALRNTVSNITVENINTNGKLIKMADGLSNQTYNDIIFKNIKCGSAFLGSISENIVVNGAIIENVITSYIDNRVEFSFTGTNSIINNIAITRPQQGVVINNTDENKRITIIGVGTNIISGTHPNTYIAELYPLT